jgi:D-beta-D-heptose 7-phosphate kinase/D-beta-D-heptose 1-phosphate adenosyltransferase
MLKPNKVVLVTGGFDPIHSGHIEYFKAAKELGDILVVGLNSDAWLARKKGQPFMPFIERHSIIEHLYMVDHCIIFNDNDDSSIEAIKNVRMLYPDCEIVFANGGDRTKENILEMQHQDSNLTFEFEVGGAIKKNSSSWLLQEWKNPKYKRPWGWYRVLDDKPGYKVKELVIEPGEKLSMQRHLLRSEHWYVLKGKCDVATIYNNVKMTITKEVNETYIIGQGVWHQGQNNYADPCHILEVQYGLRCVEEDIERKDA